MFRKIHLILLLLIISIYHHMKMIIIIQNSGLANLEKDSILLPLLHRLCHQQGHEGSIQVLPLTSDILDAVAMMIAIMVFSAHWVTTPRLCPENLGLSLSAHSLSSQRIKGDASDHVSLSALDLLKTIVYLK